MEHKKKGQIIIYYSTVVLLHRIYGENSVLHPSSRQKNGKCGRTQRERRATQK
jgi:hypothetical protein